MKDAIKIIVISGVILLGVYWVFDWAGLLDDSEESRSTATQSTKAVPMRTFQQASAVQIDRISSGLERGFSLNHAHTAESEAHSNAYFVAAELVGPGASGQVAIWMHLKTPDDPGLTMSVDGYAKEFSDWPDGSRTAARVTRYDPPARELKSFVRKRVEATSN